MVASVLAAAVLEGEDPRKFFKHISAKKREDDAKKPKAYRDETHPEPCAEWAEWEDLEPWMQVAARELEVALATEFELRRHETLSFEVASDDQHYYAVYENDDVANLEAIAYCKDSIDDDPEVWNQDFLERHIDIERLKRDLKMDLSYSEPEMLNDQNPNPEDKRDVLIRDGKLEEDEFFDENGNELEITPELEAAIDSAWEAYCDAYVDAILENPISYLEDIYGRADALKQAITIAGIDTDAAAEAAVAEDGWQHFLARYDGNSHDLPGGAVYVRT